MRGSRSCPRETKTEREKRQVEGFLRNLLAYDNVESMENNDPPDVRVWQDGRVILNLEVTEYHADPEEVAAKTANGACVSSPRLTN